MLISVFAFIWQTYIIIAFFLFFFNEAGQQKNKMEIVAILSVIGVHFFLNTKFYTTNLNNFNLFFQTILQQLFLACIPLFLISTGRAFMLKQTYSNIKREIPESNY